MIPESLDMISDSIFSNLSVAKNVVFMEYLESSEAKQCK